MSIKQAIEAPTSEQLKVMYEAAKADPRTGPMNDENWFVMGAAIVEYHYKTALEALRSMSAEPYGQVTTHSVTGQHFFYRWPESPYLDTASECVIVYATPHTAPAGEIVALRGDYDGHGYQYIDSGSGSDWRTRNEGWEPLYAAPHTAPKVVSSNLPVVSTAVLSDAERYRWLRDRVTVSHQQRATATGVEYPTTFTLKTSVGSSENIDDAIDAALAGEAKP